MFLMGSMWFFGASWRESMRPNARTSTFATSATRDPEHLVGGATCQVGVAGLPRWKPLVRH